MGKGRVDDGGGGGGGRVDYYMDDEATPVVWEVNARFMLFDTLYPSTSRGLLKIFEIICCFAAMLLVASTKSVHEERNFGLFTSFLGLSCSFTLLVAYILMLNTKLRQSVWVVMEGFFYVLMVVLLLASSVFLAVFNASYWAAMNPPWQTVPSLAAATLFVAMLLYAIDLLLLLGYWKRYSWRPTTDYAEASAGHKSVLPQ